MGPPHPGPKCQPPHTGPLCHVGTMCLFPCLLPGVANVCIGNKNNEATAMGPIKESLRDIALTPLLRHSHQIGMSLCRAAQAIFDRSVCSGPFEGLFFGAINGCHSEEVPSMRRVIYRGKSASEVLLPEVPSERPKRLRWINIGKSGVTAGLAAVTAPARDPSTHGETVPPLKRFGIAVIACCSMPRHLLSLAAFVGGLKGLHDPIVLLVPFRPPAAHVVPCGAIVVEQRSG